MMRRRRRRLFNVGRVVVLNTPPAWCSTVMSTRTPRVLRSNQACFVNIADCSW